MSRIMLINVIYLVNCDLNCFVQFEVILYNDALQENEPCKESQCIVRLFMSSAMSSIMLMNIASWTIVTSIACIIRNHSTMMSL